MIKKKLLPSGHGFFFCACILLGTPETITTPTSVEHAMFSYTHRACRYRQTTVNNVPEGTGPRKGLQLDAPCLERSGGEGKARATEGSPTWYHHPSVEAEVTSGYWGRGCTLWTERRRRPLKHNPPAPSTSLTSLTLQSFQ